MIHDDYYKHYGVESINIKELFAALIVKTETEIISIKSGKLELQGWEDNPTAHIRLKKSYYYIKEIYKNKEGIK